MNALLALVPTLARGGGRDARLTTGLAVTAFAVSTALTLSVTGALLGFVHRARHPFSAFVADRGDLYVVLAQTAVVLLVVPLVTLAGAAARLGVARRDTRLATLRLLGATPREVVGLTILETAGQGLAGAVLGIGLAAALLPVWALVPFQGRRFAPAELWPGWSTLLALLVVPLVAAVSGAWSLRRVVVSPLGVARRQGSPALAWVRVVAFVAGAALVVTVGQLLGAFPSEALAVGALLGSLALGFGALNLVGPWLLGVIGRVRARRAGTPATLLAARRLAADPKASWRVVGGLGLAAFVAAALAVIPSFGSGTDPGTRTELADIRTGGLLTLGITFLLAAVSAGIAQAAAVLDRRRELALQRLAGVPVELFDTVRRREVLVPLLVVGVGSAAAALVMLFPLTGAAALTSPGGLLWLAGSLAGGVLAVLGATETCHPLLRSVLAETVVRTD